MLCGVAQHAEYGRVDRIAHAERRADLTLRIQSEPELKCQGQDRVGSECCPNGPGMAWVVLEEVHGAFWISGCCGPDADRAVAGASELTNQALIDTLATDQASLNGPA